MGVILTKYGALLCLCSYINNSISNLMFHSKQKSKISARCQEECNRNFGMANTLISSEWLARITTFTDKLSKPNHTLALAWQEHTNNLIYLSLKRPTILVMMVYILRMFQDTTCLNKSECTHIGQFRVTHHPRYTDHLRSVTQEQTDYLMKSPYQTCWPLFPFPLLPLTPRKPSVHAILATLWVNRTQKRLV